MLGRGGGGCPRWGCLHATYYYRMHTSRGEVCLGVWGYRDIYAIIELSPPCREESLKACGVAPLPRFPSPSFPHAPRLACYKNSCGLIGVGGSKKKWVDFSFEVLEKFPLRGGGGGGGVSAGVL